MDTQRTEARICARGRELFDAIGDEVPSVFNRNWWTGKLMDWCMSNEPFKLQLFRFIDVLPTLTTEEALSRHLQEYFGDGEGVPSVLRWGTQGARLGGRLAMKVVGGAVRKNLERMARDFIVGANVSEAVKVLAKLRRRGFAFTVDLLGEASVGEQEAETYAAGYLELLDGLADAQDGWPALGSEGGQDWGHAPRVNVSVKPSALYSQARPCDFEGSVEGVLDRLRPIARRVVQLGGFLCIDVEMRDLKNITQETYRRLRADPEFRNYPHIGLALQTYLREADEDVDALLEWAGQEDLPISIRLVKGAYWDYEIAIARQRSLPIPVYTHKAETDAAFERLAEKILRQHNLCHLACASHNVRSVSAVIETANALDVPEERYEFQALYGMAEPFRKALQKTTGRVRLYCPYGDLLPGMAYLIRRLLENTSNESFLRQTFAADVDRDLLLESPAQAVAQLPARPASEPCEKDASLPPFRNEPFPDWTQASARRAYVQAIADVRSRLDTIYPLRINGEDVYTDDRIRSVNPACPREAIGHVCQAGVAEVQRAIAAARRALPEWRDTPVPDRARHLLRAAAAARKRIYELAAWQTLEVGKQWGEAYLDVGEAIDFLEYYARQMLRLGEPRRFESVPGEANEWFYQPKGVASVIAPWNFPLAISCGMVAAALVAGNCVVYKPSGVSPVVGHTLAELLREGGVPAGAFQYIPGRGSVIGDLLAGHPDVNIIAFTGSMEVGLQIIETAGHTAPGQTNIKRVIAEMGGKNAIIVDDDADLDAAVPSVLHSAFGYQGQKCSACSRVIVLDAHYDRFLERLVGAARSLRIGPAEDPANFMGPVVDGTAQEQILNYIGVARQEGSIAYQSAVPNEGFYAPLTIVTGITPEHRIAQEEVFGPVLAVMRAADLEQALEWANATRFALTGGVFSRSPARLARCRREFRVGNLYLNRGCTGALVSRQPFGGFAMSGVGSKAGGPEYLLQFLDPRTVTENTMRRGFVEIDGEAFAHG